MEWAIDVLGICGGHLLLIAGTALIGVGIVGVLTKEEHINMMVTMMSMPTAGQPQGFALTVRNLIYPSDRTTSLGIAGIVAGIVLMGIGGLIVKIFV